MLFQPLFLFIIFILALKPLEAFANSLFSSFWSFVQFNSGISNDQLRRPSNRENIRKEFSFIKWCFQLIRQSLRRSELLNKGSPPKNLVNVFSCPMQLSQSLQERRGKGREERGGGIRGRERGRNSPSLSLSLDPCLSYGLESFVEICLSSMYWKCSSLYSCRKQKW